MKLVCLIVTAGPLQGHKFLAKTDSSILIGRSDEANIRIGYDEFCSRKHAVVFWENDVCYIQDLKSTNGTLVNEKRIEEKSVLNNHDIISLGQTELVVNISESKENGNVGHDDEVSYED